ncbi:MAG TPA: tetratricopeptide repeat protein [Oscillatoriaceae cyanobacterium]
MRRNRLRARLDAAIASGEHIAVIAGSGFGKTSLLADWCADRTTAWVSLDAEDADMDAFLTYTIAALENAIPGFRSEAHALLPRARERDGARATLDALLADLDEQLEQPLVLVLDDYHFAASPSLDGLLARMLKYAPATVRMIVASRHEPEADFAALRGRRQLALVNAPDLAFDQTELAALHPTEPPDAIERLLEATGGWPAAMGMTPELLAAYVDEQILRGRTPDERAFLTRAALLDAFDPGACEETLGVRLDATMREALTRDHLLQTLDATTQSVAQPLRGLLRRRFGQDFPAEERRAVLRRIGDAQWHTGQSATALRFWSDAGEQALAADRLEAVAEDWLAKGRLEALHAAIAGLGEAGDRPTLVLADGEIARRWGDYERAEAGFERALTAFEAAKDASGVAKVRLRQAMTAASRGMIDQARACLEAVRPLMGGGDRFDIDARNLEGGIALFLGKPEEAIAHFEASLHLARRLADAYTQARAIHNLGVCYTRLGEFRRSLECYDAALAATSPDAGPAVWMTPINRALVLAHLGRPSEALEAAEAALALVRRFRLVREETFALRTLGHAQRLLGRFADAAACFESAELLARRGNDKLGVAYSLNFQAELAAATGDAEGASRLLTSIEELLGPEGTRGLPEFATVRAKVALAAGRREEAANLLVQLRAEAHGPGHLHLLAELEALLDGGTAPTPTVAPPSAELEVRCFGGLRVTRASGEAIADKDFQSAKAKLLLAYLLHSPEGATKARLFEVLYPNEATTDASLNMTIMRLRRALEPTLEKGQPSRYILRADARYSFNRQANVAVDTQAFEHALRQARGASGEEEADWLDKALACYAGEFLPEFDSEWGIALGQHFRDRALEACRRLLASREADGHDAALAVIHQALAIDPLSEEFHRELILRYLEAGEPHRAREHYTLCARRFEELLGMAPPEDLAVLVDE